MKTIAWILASLFSLNAVADEFEGHAKVLSSSPQYERFNNPRQECYEEQGSYEKNYGGAIIGGIAGAIIGNQVGGGNGRVAATAIGAATGAMVGDSMQNQPPRRHCRSIDHYESRLTGYMVQYEYEGHTFNKLMSHQPGREIPVRVSVDAEEY